MSRIWPVLPQHLELGDEVGIIAPASPPPDPRAIDRSVVALKKLGFKPRLGGRVRRRHGFLAGSDRDRAADLMAMFANQKIRAIFCLRGGYGSSRLLSRLDYALIRRQPKIVIGYSDITALHCALLRKANLVCFHGPMLNAELSRGDLPDYTLDSLLRTVMHPAPAGSLREGYLGTGISILHPGRAVGPLVGGNLSILCTMLGTPYQPDFKNRILCLEEVGEKPYRVDRMLTHLANAGILEQLAGIAVGLNRDCDDPHPNRLREYRQSVADVLVERLAPLKVPVVMGLPFGHQPWNATLPLGVQAELDGKAGDLRVLGSAVS